MGEPGFNARQFFWPVRVYHEDTDGAGVVYYANYLRFFERARTEWRHGVVFVVRSIGVEYLLPARFNDALSIAVELGEVGASQIRLKQYAMRGDETLVEAQVRLACVDIAAMKPVKMPKPLLETIRTT
jgi:acyl-CoA thioester hydrolase